MDINQITQRANGLINKQGDLTSKVHPISRKAIEQGAPIDLMQMLEQGADVVLKLNSLRQLIRNAFALSLTKSSKKIQANRVSNLNRLTDAYSTSINGYQELVDKIIERDSKLSIDARKEEYMKYFKTISELFKINIETINSPTEEKEISLLSMINFIRNYDNVKESLNEAEKISIFSASDESFVEFTKTMPEFYLIYEKYKKELLDRNISDSIIKKVYKKMEERGENCQTQDQRLELQKYLIVYIKSLTISKLLTQEEKVPQIENIEIIDENNKPLTEPKEIDLTKLLRFAFFENNDLSFKEHSRVKRWNGFLTPEIIREKIDKFPDYDKDYDYLCAQIINHSGEGLFKIINCEHLLNLYAQTNENKVTMNCQLILKEAVDTDRKKIDGDFIFVYGKDNKIYHREFIEKPIGGGGGKPPEEGIEEEIKDEFSDTEDGDTFEYTSNICPELLENGNLYIRYNNHLFIEGIEVILTK